MRLTRRTFLYSTAVTVVAAPLVWQGREPLMMLQTGEITGFLRENFHYLELEISGTEYENFYSSYCEHYAPVRRPLWQRVLKGRDNSHHRQVMDSLATRFLMSTDFFLHGADETRPVRYIALYHPYATPCWNPLSFSNSSARA